MRSFIILGLLVAAASAGVLPGYQYGPGVSGVREETVVGSSGLSGSNFGNQGSIYNNAAGSWNSGSKINSASSGIIGASSGSSSINSGVFGSSGSGSLNSGNYKQSGSGSINSGVFGSSGSGSINSGVFGSSGSGSINRGVFGSSGSGSYNSGSYKQSGSSGATLNIGYDALDSVPQTVQYSKQFYHFDAPEEAQVEGQITRQLSNVLKKNLQVVFIKAPENNAATNAALQLAKQAIEQRTAIYVLTKQNDAAQLVGKLQQIQENVQTTPEVRFVKYRTPEDVQRAKASIQSQYDNFGGISESYNGGVAPVLNYASAGKPSQFILGGSNKASSSSSGSTYKFDSKTELPELVGSGSINKQGSSIVSSGQYFGTGSNSKFGSGIVSSTQSFGSGINKPSGFGISGSVKPVASGSSSKFGSGIVSSTQSFGSGINKQSGFGISGSAKPVASGSISKFGSGIVSSAQSFGSGINKQSGFGISASAQPAASGSSFGSTIVSSTQSFGSGINKQSSFGIIGSAQPIASGSFGSSVVSSAQSIESESNNKLGASTVSSSSAQSIESESNINSESGSTLLNEIEGSSDNSSTPNLTYLPPLK